MRPLEGWLHDFVLPLVAGGDVRVQGAFGAAELERLVSGELDNDPVAERVSEARHQVMAELLLEAPPPLLDASAVRLALAVQNLLFLSHPSAHGPSVASSRRKQVASFAAAAATLEEPRSVVELVARHSVLHHLFDLGRDDVRVSFWAGRREFRGEEPPARLLAWPSLRRVREERWRVSLVAEAMGEQLSRTIVTSLLASSPLTDLLEPGRLEPRFELRAVARWLREPMVARAVADRYLQVGLEQVGPPLTTALLELCNQRGAARDARTATAFVCHLHLLHLLGEARAPEPSRRIRLESMVQRQDGLRDFLGLFAAAQRIGIGRPPDVKSDRALNAMVDAHARQCLQLCGQARLFELEGVLARGIGEMALSA